MGVLTNYTTKLHCLKLKTSHPIIILCQNLTLHFPSRLESEKIGVWLFLTEWVLNINVVLPWVRTQDLQCVRLLTY